LFLRLHCNLYIYFYFKKSKKRESGDDMMERGKKYFVGKSKKQKGEK
jgi:hypothetical protein